MVANLDKDSRSVDCNTNVPLSGCEGRKKTTMERKDTRGMATNLRSKVAYISGPYRANTLHEIEKNIFRAKQYALRYWKLGYTVICPHANTAFMDGECPDSVWLDGDLELVKRSDIVVLIPGWSVSRGALEEYQYALALGKEIEFAEPTPETLPHAHHLPPQR